jgi:murein DD-endopeptidase MepM/ murein hydrolase activator NlpD
MPVPFSTLLTAAALTVGLGPPLPAAASGPRSGGAWGWPLAGPPVVARPFQPPVTRWGAGHRGVDLAAAPGATVFTAGPGVVSFAGYVAGVGVVSIVHAGGLRTTYEPVAPAVAVGRSLAAGDPIGTLLAGHGNCGPGRWCLHWGLLRRSVYLDPLTLVGRGPVRLLPVTGGPPAAPAQPAGPLPGAPSSHAGSPTGPAVSAGPARVTGRSVVRTGPVRPAAVASAATGASGVLAWALHRAQKRRVASHRGRHRRAAGVRAPVPPAELSRAGRRAWP